MEMKIFESKTMTEIVRLFPRPNLIGKTFFPEKPNATNVAVWDVVSGARNMAHYTAPGAEAHISPLMGRKRLSAELAVIREKKTLDENTKLFLSQPGTFNEPYGEQAVTDELEALDRMVENRREKSIWEILTTGRLVVSDDETNVSFSVDFGVQSSHKPTLVTTARWSQTTTAKPLNDLIAWKNIIAQDAGVNVTDAYMNSGVMLNLINNSDIRDLLKYTIGDQLAQNGYITVLGGINLHVYDTTYVDEDGAVQKYIPDNKVILIAKEGIGKSLVGPSEVPGVTGPTKVVGKYSYSWVTKDPVDTWILAGIRDLPVLMKPDQLLIATVA